MALPSPTAEKLAAVALPLLARVPDGCFRTAPSELIGIDQRRPGMLRSTLIIDPTGTVKVRPLSALVSLISRVPTVSGTVAAVVEMVDISACACTGQAVTLARRPIKRTLLIHEIGYSDKRIMACPGIEEAIVSQPGLVSCE